jgi:hypothetical protein
LRAKLHQSNADKQKAYRQRKRNASAVTIEASKGRQKPKSNYKDAPRDRCQTPTYALDPLFRYLPPTWTIWEPAAGEGLLVAALHAGGFEDVITGDILSGQDFFTYQPERWDCIVTNPPFSEKYKWLERCYQLGKPFALLMPLETLGAASAQKYFEDCGVEIVLFDKRIDYKMPSKGWGGSSQFASAWFTSGFGLGRELNYGHIRKSKQG